MTGRVDGKVAIVTGAGSGEGGVGIGQAISIALAREGASVLLVDKVLERAETTLRSLDSASGPAQAFVADVTREDDCEAMVTAARERFGGLDILINNAAISLH